MPAPPPCTRLGRQCRELHLTLYVADVSDTKAARDGLGTWLLGHTERIRFGKPYRKGKEVLVDAVVGVGCKYLEGDQRQPGGREAVRCKAHGYQGTLPPPVRHGGDQSRRHGDGRFTLFHDGRVQTMDLPKPRRTLPTIASNPCVGAPCRTADNRRGAACCRDLTLDVILPVDDLRGEALLRARRSPYLCKVERVNERSMECEVISACDYLSPDDGVSCVLHGRKRPDGKPAKPKVCFDWPDFDRKDFTGHPGCVFLEDDVAS